MTDKTTEKMMGLYLLMRLRSWRTVWKLFSDKQIFNLEFISAVCYTLFRNCQYATNDIELNKLGFHQITIFGNPKGNFFNIWYKLK